MVQAVLVYAVVALAAGWIVWKILLPRDLKARLSPRRPASRPLKVSPRRRPPA